MKLRILSGFFLLSCNALAVETVSVTDVPIPTSHFQLGISSNVRATQGTFDPYGAYAPYPDGSSAWSWFTSFDFSYRMNKGWDFGLMVPVRQAGMSFSTGKMSSTSIGGPSANVRYHVGGWYHLIVHLGFSTPWRLRSRQIQGDPLASLPDDMGDGFVPGFAVRTGAGVSHTFRPIRVSFDASTVFPFATQSALGDLSDNAPTYTVKSGMRIQTSEGLSYLFAREWSANCSFRQAWAGDTQINGVEDFGTASRAFSTSVGLSYFPSRKWRWNGFYETQFPFYSYAVNQGYSPSVGVGMSYTAD